MAIEQTISPFIENMFPSFYKEEGQNFIAFVQAYYEWLEQNFQWIEVDSIENFQVGDIVTQEQNLESIASGVIYAIEDNFMLVYTSSFAPFRCRVKCNILAPLESNSGGSTYIIEQSKVNPLFGARNLFKYRDVDSTTDLFILNFKEKYLKNIQFNIATNKRLLIKNSLDLYRSKGTERSIELFFRLVYNKDAEVYYPGDDIFKLSNGDWFKPKYLEITDSNRAVDLVGKTIVGMSSGSKAFVEKYIKRKINTGFIYLLFISNITGDFQKGESLKTLTRTYSDAPKILGSLSTLTIISPGSNYNIGDIVEIVDEYGEFGKARVISTKVSTGEVEFVFYSGGYGYSLTPVEYLSDKILTISNISTSWSDYFMQFDDIHQNLANLVLDSISSNNISNGANVYCYYGNGDIMATGKVLDINLSTILDINVNTASNSTTLLTLSSGNTADIGVGDLIVGSTNTSVINTAISSKVTSVINSTTFEVNSDIIVANGTASIAISSTGEVGEIFVYVVSGSFSNVNVYTESNSISGSISYVRDKTVRAKIIKPSDTLKIAIANTTGTFSIGDVIYQSNGTADVANGVITDLSISGGSGFIDIKPYSGIFDSSYQIQTYDSSAECNLVSFTTSLAIQINREKNVEVTVDTDSNSTSLITITTGNTQFIQEGDYISYSSNSSVINASAVGYVTSIVNSTALVVNSDVIVSNGTSTVTFYDITDNDFIANSSVNSVTITTNTYFTIDSISLGSGADYGLVNVEVSEEVLLNTDLIDGNNSSNVPYLSLGIDASAYGFPNNPTANLSSYIMEALDFQLYQIGSITDVITTNPGQDYTISPVAVVLERPVAALNLQDYILTIEETPGTIKIGDTITQNVGNVTQVTLSGVSNVSPFYIGETVYQGSNLESSTANGIVYIANVASNSMVLVNVSGTFSNASNVISYVSDNTVTFTTMTTGTFTSEIARGIVTQTILGSNSTIIHVSRKSVPSFVVSGNVITSTANVTANVLSIEIQTDSIPIGLNANIEANVVISENSVNELEVIDSGFGYVNNSIVEFVGEAGQESGTARVSIDSYGEGIGRYRSSNGFSSEDKYIFDGDYYQEYSYEVISSLSLDKYSDIFKKVMHVAGTKLFGSIELQSHGNVSILDTSLESSVTSS